MFGTTLYLLLLGLRPDIRPEVMSMVCLSLFITMLYSLKGTDKRLLFLIPIALLWVNLHIYFFVGPILIVFFLMDNLLTYHFNFAKTKWYFISLLGTTVVTLINPNGIQGALFPLLVFHNYGYSVIENQSLLTLFTIYHSSEILLPSIAIFLLFIILFFAKQNTKPIDWILAIVFSLATIFIFRNILLFVFTTYLLFTNQLHYLIKKYHQYLKKLPGLLFIFSYLISIMILLYIIVICISKTGFGFGVHANGEDAVSFIMKNKIQGPYYNNFDIGDYLAYRFYPERVFVENRPEAYPTNFFQKTYLPMQNNFEIFKKIDKKFSFNAIIISYWDNTPWGSNLMRYLVNDSNFRLIYIDPYIIILVKDIPANKIVISKNLITKKNFNKFLFSEPDTILHYLFFFEKVGWNNQVQSALTILKKYDPQLCLLREYPLEKTSIKKYLTKNIKCPM